FPAEFVDDAWRQERRETGKQPKERIFVVAPAHVRLKGRRPAALTRKGLAVGGACNCAALPCIASPLISRFGARAGVVALHRTSTGWGGPRRRPAAARQSWEASLTYQRS